MIDDAPFWQTMLGAKEPDNLPLKEPWYSRLSRFVRLVVIVILRPDKLLELVHTFISDHVGFKFVEPLDFDLGRVLSDGSGREPILMLQGSGEADRLSGKVKRLARARGQLLEEISLGEHQEVCYLHS